MKVKSTFNHRDSKEIVLELCGKVYSVGITNKKLARLLYIFNVVRSYAHGHFNHRREVINSAETMRVTALLVREGVL